MRRKRQSIACPICSLRFSFSEDQEDEAVEFIEKHLWKEHQDGLKDILGMPREELTKFLEKRKKPFKNKAITRDALLRWVEDLRKEREG